LQYLVIVSIFEEKTETDDPDTPTQESLSPGSQIPPPERGDLLN
jgi:hypothetical protein